MPGEAGSALLTRVLLPDEWRVVVFVPGGERWHGSREQQAFDTARQVPRPAGLFVERGRKT